MIYPFTIVSELDKIFVGQAEVKRALAVVMAASVNNAVVTPNLLICGPSGTGKTTMVQEVANVFYQPYVICPVTSYTQAGYVGDNVSSIIESLASDAIDKVSETIKELTGFMDKKWCPDSHIVVMAALVPKDRNSAFYKALRAKYAKSADVYKAIFDEDLHGAGVRGIRKALPEAVDGAILTDAQYAAKEDQADWNWGEYMTHCLIGSKRGKLKADKDGNVKFVITEEELERSIYAYAQVFLQTLIGDMAANTTDYVEHFANRGVVFLDEIDKIAESDDRGNVGKSGVQRDLLAVLDQANCTIISPPTAMGAFFGLAGNAKGTPKGFATLERAITIEHGKVTFIGAGAFMVEDLSGMMDELRGRFHLITKTHEFTAADLKEIAKVQIEEFNEMSSGINVHFVFAEDGLDELATFAYTANKKSSTGARRITNVLSTILLLVGATHPNELPNPVVIDRELVIAASNEIKRSTEWKEKSIGFRA